MQIDIRATFKFGDPVQLKCQQCVDISTLWPQVWTPNGSTIIITFRMRHSRGKMYIGHGRLCVCK